MKVGEVVRVDGGVRVDLQGVNIISTTGKKRYDYQSINAQQKRLVLELSMCCL